MSRRVVLTARSERDIDAIYDWLLSRSESGAASWYEQPLSTLRSLESAPDSHPLAPENDAFDEVIRQVLFKTRRGRFYRILFRIAADEVVVLAVRGPHQDLLQPGEL